MKNKAMKKIENALELTLAPILWKYVNLMISIPAHNAIRQGKVR